MNLIAAPQQLTTERLLLRRPRCTDAQDIFDAYANDPEVTRYLGWPRHQDLSQTRAWLDFCEGSWEQHAVGAFLLLDKHSGRLLGSTGLELEANAQAATGYVLTRSAWGQGYATEALHAMLGVAQQILLRRVYAFCHVQHLSSARVLEKCGFTLQARLPAHTEFPNLQPGVALDVLQYQHLLQI